MEVHILQIHQDRGLERKAKDSAIKWLEIRVKTNKIDRDTNCQLDKEAARSWKKQTWPVDVHILTLNTGGALSYHKK